VPYLRGFALILGGYFHLKAALAAPDGAAERLARFYIQRLLPDHAGQLAHARAGAKGLMAVTPQDLAV
jgi:hypothetical protein